MAQDMGLVLPRQQSRVMYLIQLCQQHGTGVTPQAREKGSASDQYHKVECPWSGFISDGHGLWYTMKDGPSVMD